MRILLLASIATLFPLIATADDLPQELLLQCDYKSKVFPIREEMRESDSSKRLFKLKDRAIATTDPYVLLGRDCTLKDGKIIWCELRNTTYRADFDLTTKRQSSISLGRATGEMKVLIEEHSFKGKNASGELFSGVRIQWMGVCRPAGGPIF